MWKRGNVSSAAIGIHFGMTQSQFLFSQCFVGYVLVSAYWEWNLRSEAKWCQNAFQSFDVTRQLSCSGCVPNTTNRCRLREYCWRTYCLPAAHFSQIKWPTGTSLKILPYPSKSGNAAILTRKEIAIEKVVLEVLAGCPIAPSTVMSFMEAMKHFSLPWIRHWQYTACDPSLSKAFFLFGIQLWSDFS